MASKRLTNQDREAICKAVLRHRFTDEVEALVKDRAAFADDVYNDVYRKADRDRIDALPDGWLPQASCITAKFGDADRHYADVQFDGSIYGTLRKLCKSSNNGSTEVLRRVPTKYHHRCVKIYPNDHRLTTRYVKLNDRQQDLLRRVNEGEAQINAALGSVTTVAALLKAWPEVEPFLGSVATEHAKLPSIPVKVLNAAFRLPVSEAA